MKEYNKQVRIKHDVINNSTIVLLIETRGNRLTKSCLQNDGSWKVLKELEEQTAITVPGHMFDPADWILVTGEKNEKT